MKLKWKEPPPSRPSGRDRIITDDLLAALKARPGKWAIVVPPRKGDVGTNVRHWGKQYRDFEFAGRKEPTGNVVYARYVGDGEKIAP